ncbi:MAG: hypothetical protein LBV69_02690 [Bacteroidales bacterium]|jgi:hypothetical protein|nr:hypothetical protein [Bacteroidales bacterium]
MGGRGTYLIKERKYNTLFTIDNIKVIESNEPGNVSAPYNSITPERIYATTKIINGIRELKTITYYDNDRQIVIRIDLTASHAGLKEHAHYFKNGVKTFAALNDEQKKLVSKIRKEITEYEFSKKQIFDL